MKSKNSLNPDKYPENREIADTAKLKALVSDPKRLQVFRERIARSLGKIVEDLNTLELYLEESGLLEADEDEDGGDDGFEDLLLQQRELLKHLRALKFGSNNAGVSQRVTRHDLY